MTGPWHILTGEYPPQRGGVADYTFQVAAGLAAAGDEVHVWCPRLPGPSPGAAGVTIHPVLGAFEPAGLRELGRALDMFEPPRRLLVQWVPHAWGWRSMNVPFCEWLWRRSRHDDSVDLIVHEAFLAFGKGGVRWQAAAAVHRLMTFLVLRGARRVWVTTPAWATMMRRYAIGRNVRFDTLPVPSNVPVVQDPARVRDLRARYVGSQAHLLGHYGTYGRDIAESLVSVVPALLAEGASVLLLGRNAARFRSDVLERVPLPAGLRVQAAEELAPRDLSLHLQACDILLQPYPDGATGRRTTLTAALSHALPVVTTVGRWSEPLWQQSRAVAAVPAGDNAALVAAVRHLCEDPVERARLRAAAAALYDRRFDLRHTIEALRADRAITTSECASSLRTGV
ncbi:MAG: glycosyltransferase [Vicinamibacterales bacterium]